MDMAFHSSDGGRTWKRVGGTLGPEGATCGTVIPPLDALTLAGRGETLEIPGPVGGPAFRTNLALVCVVSGAGVAHVEIIDERGSLRSAFDAPVSGEAIVQVDDVFRARGLGDGPVAAAIHVTFTNVLGAAYATTIDNGTNDPVYFAGALGSH